MDGDSDSENISLIRHSVPDGKKTCTVCIIDRYIIDLHCPSVTNSVTNGVSAMTEIPIIRI